MIRSSAQEFLTFKVDEKEKGIQVRYENETLWMMQKAMAELFDDEQPAIENGSFVNQDYFEKLLAEIREIRLFEKRFYQKITDIYATSIDYDRNSPITIMFFKKVQNKIHYSVSYQTAARS